MIQKGALSEQELTALRATTRELGLHEATAEVLERALDELAELRQAIGRVERLGALVRESLSPEALAFFEQRMTGVAHATHDEEAKDGEERCGQNGCKRPAFGRYTWPGRDEGFICFDHIAPLKRIAEAMGFNVAVIPLRLQGHS